MRVLFIDFSPFMPAATPISLGYIAAVLKARGHGVKVISLGSDSKFSPLAFQSFVREYSPDLIGLGTYQRNISHVEALAALAKAACPRTHVILGGPQITFIPDSALKGLPSVDFLCRGEGEAVILAVADAILSNSAHSPIPGVTGRGPDGDCWTGPPVGGATDLDQYPSPWLEGILDPSEMEEAIMLTSRGCPHACAFCYTPAASGRKIRTHSVERVLEEIAFVSRRGSGRLWFADPNFSFDENRVSRILEGIIRRGLKVSMWIETRADMLNRELAELMRRSGVHTAALGLESASENVFPYLDKKLAPENVRTAVELLQTGGIEVELFSQFALPRERLTDALETLNFVKRCGVKIKGNTNAQQMQLYFGSQMCADPARYGIKPLRECFPLYLSIGTAFETEWMTREEIEKVKAVWRAESLDGGKRVVS